MSVEGSLTQSRNPQNLGANEGCFVFKFSKINLGFSARAATPIVCINNSSPFQHLLILIIRIRKPMIWPIHGRNLVLLVGKEISLRIETSFFYLLFLVTLLNDGDWWLWRENILRFLYLSSSFDLKFFFLQNSLFFFIFLQFRNWWILIVPSPSTL